ncbi:hypothetical protein [Priestia aryabhattai]
MTKTQEQYYAEMDKALQLFGGKPSESINLLFETVKGIVYVARRESYKLDVSKDLKTNLLETLNYTGEQAREIAGTIGWDKHLAVTLFVDYNSLLLIQDFISRNSDYLFVIKNDTFEIRYANSKFERGIKYSREPENGLFPIEFFSSVKGKFGLESKDVRFKYCPVSRVRLAI